MEQWCIKLLNIMPITTTLNHMLKCSARAVGRLQPSIIWTNNNKRCASQTQISRTSRICPSIMSPLVQRPPRIFRRHWGVPNRTPLWNNIRRHNILYRANQLDLRSNSVLSQPYSRSSQYQCPIINSCHHKTPPPVTTWLLLRSMSNRSWWAFKTRVACPQLSLRS